MKKSKASPFPTRTKDAFITAIDEQVFDIKTNIPLFSLSLSFSLFFSFSKFNIQSCCCFVPDVIRQIMDRVFFVILVNPLPILWYSWYFFNIFLPFELFCSSFLEFFFEFCQVLSVSVSRSFKSN